MTNVIQLHNATPEQLVQELLKGIEEKFKEFKKELFPKDDALLSRKEAAKLLKVDESTIHNWVVRGVLKKYLLGNRAYYKRDEIMNNLVEIDNAN